MIPSLPPNSKELQSKAVTKGLILQEFKPFLLPVQLQAIYCNLAIAGGINGGINLLLNYLYPQINEKISY